MNDIKSNFYRAAQQNAAKSKNPKKAAEQVENYFNTRQKKYEHNEYDNVQEIKAENAKLKKLLKQAQAKRSLITKQCSQVIKKLELLENQNQLMAKKLKEGRDVNEGEKYRFDELKFLNKELNTEIQALRRQNEDLTERLRYNSEIIERKYEQLQERTFKKMEQALKRIKKAIHYLSSLTARQIQKTREIQVENLKKAVEVLKGKYSEDNYENEIEELMSPIRNIQEELHQRTKQLQSLKEEHHRVDEQLRKHKKIEKELMPQYKQAIDKLKKNLGQVRSQLSENQYDKCQLKKKYEEKIRECEIKYDQLFKQHRKIKLQNKIYEKKLEEMEADVEEEKERLMGENELLKKLYRSDGESESEMLRDTRVDGISYKTTTNFRRPEITEVDLDGKDRDTDIENQRFIKKNYSASQLRNPSKERLSAKQSRSRLKLKNSRSKNYEYLRHPQQKHNSYAQHIENSDQFHDEGSSMISQESLKNQIFKIDKQIMQIQQTLNRELQIYK